MKGAVFDTMNQTTGKKRVKIAAAAAVLSAAAIIIILVCVWNVSIKNRTVDALDENASKAEATTSNRDISDEEKDEMYLSVAKPYIDWLSMALNYAIHDPAFELSKSVNVHDSGCEFIGNPINGTITCIRGRNINNDPSYGI